MKLVDWFLDINPDALIDKTLDFGGKVLSVIAILVIGFWLVKKACKLFYLFMVKRKLEASLRDYLRDVLRIALNIIVVLTAIAAVGINLNGVLAVVGGAALFLGVGLQGGISNLAGGVMIILNKPYKVGDLIKMQGQMGFVEKIEIFNTSIRTINNEVIILPNSPVFNESVTNCSIKGSIRIDVSVGIEYDCDYKKLISLIRSAIRQDKMFSNLHPVTIGIENFDDSSIALAVRAHTKVVNYWDAPLRLNKIIKETMDENEYKIPFPQRDLHIISNGNTATE